MRVLLFGLLLVGLGCAGTVENDAQPVLTAASDAWFEPATDTGIDFVHIRARESHYWFPEIMSGGVAWIDYDRDGDPDLYLVQGGAVVGDNPDGNRLYRNDGGRFVDVTAVAGVGDHGYGMGAIVSDLDDDGYPDLYVTNLGPNTLYRNRGDGTFAAVPDQATDPSWGTSGAALDYDSDGDLDLFVVNYVSWSPEIELECYGVGGGRDYCHPSRYQSPAADVLLRNDGEFRFTDVSSEVGLDHNFGNGLGVTLGDFTGDSALDIYVANDGMPNQLWSIGAGELTDVAVERGCSVSGLGAAEAGMGVASADLDGDGSEDLFVTHLARETNTLYLNRDGICRDSTATAGLAAPSLPMTGFGTGLADFDLDGAIDIWVGNGRVGRETLEPDIDPFREPDHVYRGSGPTQFELLSSTESGVGLTPDTTRGVALADYDLDGDVDVVTVENNGPVRLYRNRSDGGAWLDVLPIRESGAPFLAARVTVKSKGRSQTRQIGPASSYCSSNDPWAHFGLANSPKIERLLLERTTGKRLALEGVPRNRRLLVPGW